MLRFEILTLFPRMVEGPLCESILGKAREKGLIEVALTDIRDFAEGKHRICDDSPYGGGAGMVMKPEPLVMAIEAARARSPGAHVVLMDPRGRRLDQAGVRRLYVRGNLVLVCGRYEGVDERVRAFVDEELSLGDFILTGGELAALTVVDAVSRLAPGVLGNEASPGNESFEDEALEHPQYTRPPQFRGMKVPEVLLSGDHARVARWRRAMSLRTTRDRRPDLFAKRALSEEDAELLQELREAEGDTHAEQDP
ncbi:MAG: tRNA (guanosine(37)-N1)-methyltransferase TrmD [Deltaproteobacteria bacterium]|nr:tRNA (guanosine(37)-N1)-methyltransferase TrmD [Deltaproteobacteria bacterium]